MTFQGQKGSSGYPGYPVGRTTTKNLQHFLAWYLLYMIFIVSAWCFSVVSHTQKQQKF